MKSLAVLAILVPVLAFSTGCASSASPVTPTPPTPQQVQTLWTLPTNLVGPPEVVGDTIVSYLREKNQLRVAAWNLTDGRVLWSADAETSGQTPGMELSVDTVTIDEKSYVAYLTKQRAGTWRELVIADVRTGPQDAAAHLIVWPSSSPYACSDDKAFCMQGYRESAPNKEVNLRIDPLVPSLATDHSDGVPAGSRGLGQDIFATNHRSPKGVERLGRMANDKVIWQRPYADVFGKGSSSDYGWEWVEAHDGIVVGLGAPQQCHATHKSGKWTMTCDFALGRVVGLNHDTGATVWSMNGANSCPTASLEEISTADRIIACHSTTAKATYTEKKGRWALKSKMDRTELIALSQQTGEVLWRTDLGTETREGSDNNFVTSRDRMVLTINNKTTVYDLATGAATPADAASRFMCFRDRPTLKLHWLGSKGRTEYTIGEDVEPCDRNGKAVKEIPTDWVPAAGVDAGDGRWLLPTRGSMTLVKLV
jgi:outer membrane protein assembly factor BamB